jgi:hypothetical protein
MMRISSTGSAGSPLSLITLVDCTASGALFRAFFRVGMTVVKQAGLVILTITVLRSAGLASS